MKENKKAREKLLSLKLLPFMDIILILMVCVSGNDLSDEVVLILLICDDGGVGHRIFDKALAALLGNAEKNVMSGKSEVYARRTNDRIELSEYLKAYLNSAIG